MDDETGALQLAEPLGQQPARAPGQAAGQLVKARGADQEVPDDEQGPAVPEQLQGSRDGAVLAIAGHREMVARAVQFVNFP
ncbi:hypothetical protein GCM10017691_51600 [Pseudonocardia petroleophila]